MASIVNIFGTPEERFGDWDIRSAPFDSGKDVEPNVFDGFGQPPPRFCPTENSLGAFACSTSTVFPPSVNKPFSGHPVIGLFDERYVHPLLV